MVATSVYREQHVADSRFMLIFEAPLKLSKPYAHDHWLHILGKILSGPLHRGDALGADVGGQ